jgi:tRNA (guanine-N7-)-methyltransferase
MGRIRTNVNAVNLIKVFPSLAQQPQDNYFSNNNHVELEIGMGKGDFLIQKAINNPMINFIGVERDSTIVWKALKKIQRLITLPKNLLIINVNAEEINK